MSIKDTMLLRNEIKKLKEEVKSTSLSQRQYSNKINNRNNPNKISTCIFKNNKEYIPMLLNIEDEEEYMYNHYKNKKLNDYTSVNTSKDISNLLRFIKNNNQTETNSIEKQTKPHIYSQSKQNTGNIRNQQKVDAYFERRTKKKEEKLEKIKIEKEIKQSKDLLYKPILNKRTCELSEKMKGCMNVFERLTCGKDIRKKEENLKRIKKQNSFDYKPVINQRSKDIKRGVMDLFSKQYKKDDGCDNKSNNQYNKSVKTLIDYKNERNNSQDNTYNREYMEYKELHINKNNTLQIGKAENICIYNNFMQKDDDYTNNISKIDDQSTLPAYINVNNNDQLGLEELLKEENYDVDMYLINKYKHKQEEIINEPLTIKTNIHPILKTQNSNRKFSYKPQIERVNDRFINEINAFSEKHPDKVKDFIAIRANLSQFYKEKAILKDKSESNIKGGYDNTANSKMLTANLNCLDDVSRRYIIDNKLIK